MLGSRSSFAHLRLAYANGTEGALHMMVVPREEGLALLEWLGLGRPDFGAISGRELAPRCRRRLWPVFAAASGADPVRVERTRELLAIAEQAGEGMVVFG